MNTQEHFGRFCFDGIKTSIECSSDKFVVFLSTTGPIRTLSIKSAYQVRICIAARYCIFSATSVDPSELFDGSQVSKHWPIANFCRETCFLRQLRHGFALFVVSHSVSRSCWILSVRHVREVVCGKFGSFTITSFFVLMVLVKRNAHCGVNAFLVACANCANNHCFRLSHTLKVNGLLVPPGLEISFQEWFSTKILDVKLLQTSVSFSWRFDPMLR